jgi:hypothetical protein
MNARFAEMFHRLADLPPDARAHYFDEHEVDPGTRREMEELLAHDSSDAGWFSQPVGISARAYLDEFYAGDITPSEARLLYIDLTGKASVVCRQAGSLPQIWGIPSPDGKHVAIMMHTDDSNVYLLDAF